MYKLYLKSLENEHQRNYEINRTLQNRPAVCIPYFLGYKMDFFSFQNNPKDLDPSYKTDLDL